MSLVDSIDDLITHGDGAENPAITVTRRGIGTLDAGVYIPNPNPTTFLIDACVQPAFNLNRVVGGADLKATFEGQSITDVRQLFTRTELKTRTPETDPDVLTLFGADWTVARVERWDGDDDFYFHVVITKQTFGAS
jgi:hypothetical protein